MKTERQGRRGPLFYALLCAVIGIWSYVIVQVARSLGGPDMTVAAAPAPAPTQPIAVPTAREEAAVYIADFRDPFDSPLRQQAPPPTPEEPEAAPTQPQPPNRPPPLALSGVIGDTAMLLDADGTVHFVRPGETAAGVKLLQVQPDQALLRFEGRTFTLNLSAQKPSR